MLCGGKTAVYCQHHRQHVNILWWQNSEYDDVKTSREFFSSHFMKGSALHIAYTSPSWHSPDQSNPPTILQCVRAVQKTNIQLLSTNYPLDGDSRDKRYMEAGNRVEKRDKSHLCLWYSPKGRVTEPTARGIRCHCYQMTLQWNIFTQIGSGANCWLDIYYWSACLEVTGRIRDTGQNVLESSFQTSSSSPIYCQIFFLIEFLEEAFIRNTII